MFNVHVQCSIPQPFLLFLLLLRKLLLLLGSDLLPGRLLLLQSLQLLLLLGPELESHSYSPPLRAGWFLPLVPPLGDVVLQLSVKLIFFGLDIVRSHDV